MKKRLLSLLLAVAMFLSMTNLAGLTASAAGNILLEDDFSGDLSKWDAHNAQIVDGKVQVNEHGLIYHPASWTNYVLEFDADFNGNPYRGISIRRQASGDDYLWWFNSGEVGFVKRVGGGWQPVGDTHPAEAMNGTRHFQVIVKENTFYGLVDGQLWNTATDDSLTGGGILLMVEYDKAWFDNLVVRELTKADTAFLHPETPDFEDDFSGDLSQWDAVNAQIVDGKAQINEHGLLYHPASWTDCVLEFDADFNGSPYRGISIRRQANGDDYLWWFNSGEVGFVKRVGGGWQPIGETHPAEAMTGIRHFKLVAKGDTLYGYVDGQLWSTATDDALANGGILLMVEYDKAWFDNVIAREVTAADLGGEAEPEKPDFADDFSGDLSKWDTNKAEIVDGKVQIGENGLIYHAATWTDYVLEFDADFNGSPYRGISFRRQENGDDYLWWFNDATVGFVKRVGGGWQPIGDTHPAEAMNGARHFKVVAKGDTLYGYVDGQLWNTATDDTLTGGGILMMVAYDTAWFDNVVVRQVTEADLGGEAEPETPDFTDDFSGDLSQWNASKAEIVDGKVQIGENGLIYHAATWTDYVLEFDADFNGHPYRGISFRRQENGDDYIWWFGDGNSNIVIMKRVGGGSTVISDVHPSEALTGMHHFKLVAKGDTFYGFVDGQLWSTATDDAITGGGILMAVAYDTAWFDNIVVREVTEADLDLSNPTEPETPDFTDDFSADLSKWNVSTAQITDGTLQLGPVTDGIGSAWATPTVGSSWTDYVLEFDADFNGSPYRGISFRRQANGDDYLWWFGSGDVQIVKRIGGGWQPIGDAHPAEAMNGTHSFKLVVKGDTFCGYVDGQLWNTGTDPELTSGGALLMITYDTAWFDNVVIRQVTEADLLPPEPEKPDFTDDFSGDLSQWDAGNAQIVDGKVQVNEHGLIYHPASWTDYVLEFDADFNGNPYRGISIRRQAGGDDYLWWFNSGEVGFVKRIGGGWQPIGDTHPAEAMTGTRHFKLVAKGNTLYGYVDGQLWNTATDDALADGGILMMVEYDTAWFDNVVVREVTEADLLPPEPEKPDFTDDFSGDLSQWDANKAEIVDGKVQIGENGLIYHAATWADYVLEFDADFNGHPYRGISFRRQENGDDYLWWFGDGNSGVSILKRVGGSSVTVSDVYPAEAMTGTRHFKLVAKGDTFYGYVDGQLWNTATDDALTGGGILLMVAYDTAWFDNVVVREVTEADLLPPEPEMPDFKDNFSGDLTGWSVNNAQLSDGRLQLGVVGGGNNTATATPTVGSRWTDYVLEFDADFNGNPYRGISFRRQGSGDDYLWWFGDGNSNIKIAKRTGGTWTDISNAQPGTGMTGTHHFKLVVNGDTYYGLVDNTLFVTGQDAEFTSGGIQLMTTYDAAWFDNVVIRQVTEADLDVGELADPTVPDFKDNFSGDLNGWIKDKAKIVGGRLQLGTAGGGAQSAYATPTVGSEWTDYVLEFDADFNGESYRGISFRRQGSGDDYLWWFGDGNSNIQIIKRVNGGWKPIGNAQPATNMKGTHHFKLVVKGDTFTAFVDGKIYNIAKDAQLTKGGFMLMLTYDAAWFDNVVVRSYKDGDEKGVMANLAYYPDYWPKAEIDEKFVTEPANWSGALYEIKDGKLHLGKTNGRTLEAYYGPTGGYNWTDYVVEFDADFSNENYRGISFRRQRTGGDYLWWFGDSGLGTLIMKRTATGWKTVSDVQPSKRLSGMHKLKLVVKGNQFLTFVDGVLCNIGSDSAYQQGGIQFFVNYSDAWIDNLVVRAVEPEDLVIDENISSEIPNLTEDFEGELSGWNTEFCQLIDGKLQLGAIGGGELYAYAAPLVGKNWTDYVLTVDINFGGLPYRGISFRRQDNGDDYLLWFGDSDMGVQIVKRVNGGWQCVSDVFYDMIVGGGDHRIKLEVVGSDFKVSVDGAPILTGHDEELKKGGVLFMCTYEAMWIDNVSVQEPGKEPVQDLPDDYTNDPFGVDGWEFPEATEGTQQSSAIGVILCAVAVAVIAGAAVIVCVVLKKKKANQ